VALTFPESSATLAGSLAPTSSRSDMASLILSMKTEVGFRRPYPAAAELDALLLEELDRAARCADVLCVSDQFQNSCITALIREKIIELAKAGLNVVVDSRYRIGMFEGCILKPNELEGAAAVKMDGLRGIEGFRRRPGAGPANRFARLYDDRRAWLSDC